MADELHEFRYEAEEAVDRIWFIGAVEEIERTDLTLSIRLHNPARSFRAGISGHEVRLSIFSPH